MLLFKFGVKLMSNFRFQSPEALILLNVINLRKRTIPDVFTPIHGIKTSGIVLGVSFTI